VSVRFFLMIDPKFVEEPLELRDRRFSLRVTVPASGAATSLRRSLRDH